MIVRARNLTLFGPLVNPLPSRRRVLVVEDEVIVALLVEDMLAELGHEVVGLATSLEEAMRLAGTLAIDLAILDINLDGRASFPVAELLARRGVPFLFATGYAARVLEPEWRHSPILHKPFQVQELRRIIASLA